MSGMPEHIEREALLQVLEEVGGCDAPPDSWADGWDKGISEAIKFVKELLAADVVEVRRGKWIGEPSVTISANKGRTIRSTIYKCSLCNKTNGRIKKPYCPNCGAKMDGGNNNA